LPFGKVANAMRRVCSGMGLIERNCNDISHQLFSQYIQFAIPLTLL
jgi:hypothetical protein